MYKCIPYVPLRKGAFDPCKCKRLHYFRKGDAAVNTYASLKKRNNSRAMAAVFLALCVLLSGTVLFSRLLEYATADTRHYIPLTRSGGITTVTEALRADAQEDTVSFDPSTPVLLAVSPFLSTNWFNTHDANTVWQGHTDIEIFRISYENGTGSMTVNSSNGQKVLAPGTASTYSFALENTGTNAVQYEMNMEAWFTDGTHAIPVNARVCDHSGRYLAGTGDSYADVLELNSVSDAGTLRAGYIMPYTLEWEWPFEEDDAYDTLLGDLAADEDITLTIVINTVASYTPADDGGIPKTGDTSSIGLMFILMILSAAALIFLLYRRKGEPNENR